jgi:hypothetical protein
LNRGSGVPTVNDAQAARATIKLHQYSKNEGRQLSSPTLIAKHQCDSVTVGPWLEWLAQCLVLDQDHRDPERKQIQHRLRRRQ